ncbi:MAG: branched-chain amino acid ABC transporter permease [Actinomycetota bacterium]
MAILGPALALPLFVSGTGADLYSLAIIFAIIGLSLNVLMGYAGQISLGHQAFVGVGAFAAASFTSKMHLPFYLSIPMAGALGGAVAIILGLIALRIKGLYLALITLAYGVTVSGTIFGITKLTGGGGGIAAPRPAGFTGDRAYAYLCVFVLCLLLFVDWRMLRSKFGRALLAIKENELVASSFGMNIVFYKVGAFVVAGIFAGIGGGLFAFHDSYAVAANFDFQLALTFVVMTVIGGLGNRTGVVIGSAFTAYLPFLLNSLDNAWHLNNKLVVSRFVIQALLLLLTITRFPGGIGQQIHPITEWLSGKPFPRHHKPSKPSKPKRDKAKVSADDETVGTEG